MLDIHPPREAAHTWKDFFIHIATICVGLLIAIALEQTVEALHHYDQREALERRMHEESLRNLALLKPERIYATQSRRYLARCIQALEAGPASGGAVTVTLPVNDVNSPMFGILVSPSRGAWTVAKAAGAVALLPPETANIYARVDLDADFEQQSEIATGAATNTLESAEMRAGVLNHHGSPVRLTVAQRDDLLFAFNQSKAAYADLEFRLAVLQGALQAVVDNIHTLEQMYPYQQRAVEALSI